MFYYKQTKNTNNFSLPSVIYIVYPIIHHNELPSLFLPYVTISYPSFPFSILVMLKWITFPLPFPNYVTMSYLSSGGVVSRKADFPLPSLRMLDAVNLESYCCILWLDPASLDTG